MKNEGSGFAVSTPYSLAKASALNTQHSTLNTQYSALNTNFAAFLTQFTVHSSLFTKTTPASMCGV